MGPTSRVSLLSLVIAALLVEGCFVDRGQTFVADNRTDQELVARVTGTERVASSSTATYQPHEEVLSLPAHTRLDIAQLGFTGPFDVQKVEILSIDCGVIATFDQGEGVAFARDGSLFIIENGPSVTLRQEFPESSTLAASSDRCRTSG